ncbi:low temperature requirement protein A [Streptomyces sp. GbtcB7]|uniref:low temperature requirement protein A n=1 Tax=Streptomyces sp. GbtcB7 TaxID=2824752 RepID=UPI0020C5ECE1|nr:low temperature requirement protein A [Streptomyces sp. GbtcB7]
MAGTDPGHLTWHGLGLFAAVFALVWIAWFNGTLHHELHGHEDARGRSMFLLQILVLVPLGAFIPEAGGARGVAFAVTAGVLFAVLAMLWLLAARGDSPEFRRPSRLFVTGTAACALVLAASAALPAETRVLTWGLLAVAYLAGFAAMVGTATPVQAVALSVTDALTERFGLFIIIVLGETVTGVVDGLAHEPTNALTLAVGLMCRHGPPCRACPRQPNPYRHGQGALRRRADAAIHTRRPSPVQVPSTRVPTSRDNTPRAHVASCRLGPMPRVE